VQYTLAVFVRDVQAAGAVPRQGGSGSEKFG